MKIKKFTFNPYEENTYIIYNSNKECIVIDPGCSNYNEENELSTFIKNNNLIIQYAINTHFHIDHVIGNRFIKKSYPNCKLASPFLEKDYLKSAGSFASIQEFTEYVYVEPDLYIKDLDIISIKNIDLEVIHIPGHSPGHIILYNKKEKICFGGDVLFKGSIGRGDLPGGDHKTLIEHIMKKLIPLGDQVIVYPGHGEKTQISEEKIHNPFIKSFY